MTILLLDGVSLAFSFRLASYSIFSTPAVTDEFKVQLKAQSDSDEPSCSLADALERQDLFVNPALTDLDGSLL